MNMKTLHEAWRLVLTLVLLLTAGNWFLFGSNLIGYGSEQWAAKSFQQQWLLAHVPFVPATVIVVAVGWLLISHNRADRAQRSEVAGQ